MNLKFVKSVNFTTTIYYLILSIINGVTAIILAVRGALFGALSSSLLKEKTYGENDVTGGFDVLFRFIGGGFGTIIAIVMIILAVAGIILFGICLSVTILGFRCRSLWQKGNEPVVKKIRNDTIYKLVINSLFLAGSIAGVFTMKYWMMGFGAVIFMIFEVLLICSLVKIGEAVRMVDNGIYNKQ